MKQFELSHLFDFLTCPRKFLFRKLYPKRAKEAEWFERKLNIQKAIINKNFSQLKKDRDFISAYAIRTYMEENGWSVTNYDISWEHDEEEFTIHHKGVIDKEGLPVYLHISNRSFRRYPIFKITMILLKEEVGTLLWNKRPNINIRQNEEEFEFSERLFYNSKINTERVKPSLEELNNNKLWLPCLFDFLLKNPIHDNDFTTYEKYRRCSPSACTQVVEECAFYKECWNETPKHEIYSSPKMELGDASGKRKALFESFRQWKKQLNEEK